MTMPELSPQLTEQLPVHLADVTGDELAAPPGTARLHAFLEIKTVWHPTGALSLSSSTCY
jgi:hypothetical protein